MPYPSYQRQSSTDPTSPDRASVGGGFQTPTVSPAHNAESRALTSSSVRRNISNLSLEESDASSISVKGFGPVPKIKGHKKWLAGITLAFVLLSVILRGRGDADDDGAGGKTAVGTTASSGSTTPTLMVEGESEDDMGKHSCGSYFEPTPIMNLKNSSTVENVANGAVAADNKVCSVMGTSVMEDLNGNAADAAVATALCLGVVNPASSGIGGGAFILVHGDWNHHHGKINHEAYEEPKFTDLRGDAVAKEGQSRKPIPNGRRTTGRKRGKKVTEFIDARETAPAASTYDMFEQLPNEASVNGGLAIAVPGELRGLEVLHSRHGKLDWSDVVRPAMDLAENGFEVSQHLAHDILYHGSRYADKYPALASMLSHNGDGKTWYKEGDICKRPEYAATLRAVMEHGADAVYSGSIARAIARDIQDAGGIISEKDLNGYRPVLRDPLVAHDVGGFTMVGAPPPSSGGAAVIGAARFLAGYTDSIATFPDTLSKHRIVEAFKHVFSIRMSMSDPAFSNVTHDAAKDMVEGTYMDKLRRATLDHGVLPLSEYGGKKWCQVKDVSEGNYKEVAEDAHEGDRRKRKLRRFNYLEDRGTTHLAVVDEDRNAVSITSTVNTYFGSKVVSPSTGIVFNDEMDDFSTPGRPNLFGLPPSEANYIAPFKRPLSSMSPTIVFRRDFDELTDEDDLGKLFMTLGSSGGPKIITAVLQVFINHALLGMPLYSAVANPRIHDQLLYHDAVVTTYDKCPLLQGPVIEVTNRTRNALRKRGHKILPVDYLGTTQAVAIDLETDLLSAVSDIRKVGTPAGY